MSDLLLPDGAVLDENEVNEVLGLKPAAPQPLRGPAFVTSVNLQVLNAIGRRWIDAEDLARAFKAWAETEPLDRVSNMYRDIARIVTGEI